MSLTNEQKIFLDKMDIDHIRIIKLNRDIQNLIEIADDFEHHRNGLLDEAAYIANKLQRCKGVHSVRSRVKDTGHLIEKIIRKWEEKEVSEKYKAISKDNYKSTITDLIGVRAIYLKVIGKLFIIIFYLHGNQKKKLKYISVMVMQKKYMHIVIAT